MSLNKDLWKRFEGQDVALFIWEGKPYRSKQKVFCVKRIVSVQGFSFVNHFGGFYGFYGTRGLNRPVTKADFAKNDGFGSFDEMLEWFHDYPSGEMAILHFTDFRY
jgi:hypothetical protein